MTIALAPMFVAASMFGHNAPARPVVPARQAKVEVRDHRVVQPVVTRPVVRDHRTVTVDRDDQRRDKDDARRINDRDRDRDRDDVRVRPIVVAPAPIITRPVYTTSAYESPYSTSYTYQPQPLALTGAISMTGGPIELDVGSRLIGHGTLQLDAVGGGLTCVDSVTLYYANGGSQVITVDQVLDANNPTLNLGLADAAAITHVSVAGHSEWGGAIAIDAI